MSQSQHSRVIPPQSQPPVRRVTGDANLPALKKNQYFEHLSLQKHEPRTTWSEIDANEGMKAIQGFL